MQPRPIVLIILDGWGYRESPEHNAIANAHTPVWNHLWQHYPHTTLSASGTDVGLPEGQMGNSEVGHLTMGAGRVVDQDLCRIDKAILDGSFKTNPIFLQPLDTLAKTNHCLHILGLLSPGGVHSHENHIFALIELAASRGVKQIEIHAFLDGRDCPPKSALASLQKLEALCQNIPGAQIASLCGRYYAMDRDSRWERTEAAYRLLTENFALEQASTAEEGLMLAYNRGETDEFVKPTLINHPLPIQDQDAVICMNFRTDRARQLCHAFLDKDFSGFERHKIPELSNFVTLTEYDKALASSIAFPPQILKNTVGECLESAKLRQLRCAETEKYAHVTFFFNGGREAPYVKEERILIPSKTNIPTYDLSPEMSALELTDSLIKAIESQAFDVIIINFANADMVGHSGHFKATISAIECLDKCLGRIIPALQAVGGEALITADHGNAEYMFDENTNQAHTAHTSRPVPMIYIGRSARINPHAGSLADIGPTLLRLLGLNLPKEMTGTPLVDLG